MNTTTTPPALIVETPRGPSLVGTRITVYSVMDYLKGKWSRFYIRQMLGITDEQLDAVINYVAEHKEEVERDYERIVRRAEELRVRYEEQNRARSPFPPDMPWEERRKLMLQKLAQMKRTEAEKNGHHDTH